MIWKYKENNIKFLKNTKASVFIYVLVLINLVMIVWVVIIANSSMLMADYKISSTDKEVLYELSKKWKIALNISKGFNSDWSWFIDNISCPDTIVMSWNTVREEDISTSITYSWTVFCSWLYNWENLKIYFNDYYSDFIWSSLWDSYIDLSSWDDKVWLSLFSDSDNTLISFSWSSYQKWDNIDDDFNSDNYSICSSGGIAYPNNYEDDDSNSRKTIYWYIPTGWDYHNIFWSNTKISEYIEKNQNNINDFDSILAWNGYLYLKIDKSSVFKLVKFDKSKYNTQNELYPLEISDINYTSDVEWYIQDDLTLSSEITWEEYTFDFSNYDYALFLKNNNNEVLSFSLSWKSTYGKCIYINPINDSSDKIEIMLNTIKITESGRFFWKISELVWNK